MLNNEVQNYLFVTNGNFSISALPFTNYILAASTSSGSLLMNVTSVAQSDTLDVGGIQTCNEPTASTGFTLDGMGYVNSAVNLDIVDQNQANYYTWSNTTYGHVGGISNLGVCNINIGFEGNVPITIDATIQQDSAFYINLNGISLVANSTSPNHLMITITEYGAVGDSIKGTFYGDVESEGGLSTGTITNGRFAFLRDQDH
jgi:hypothetical protein